MKTIIKQLFFAVILATMALSVSAQTADPCEGLNEAYGKWVEVQFPKKDIAGLKEAVESAKVFIEKYGTCPTKDAYKDSKELVDYVSGQIPIKEKRAKVLEEQRDKNELIKRFDANLGKNWDEVYAASKDLLARWPEEFRHVKLALGTFGYDETRKNPPVTKWNDETIKYAKEAIADIEAGKTFAAWGVPKNWVYKGKEDALGWMNYNIGYILSFSKGDLKGGALHMYKVSQMNVDASKDAAVYGALTKYYIPLLNAEVKKLQELPIPAENEPEETGKPKADAIKAQTGVIRGLAERIMETLGQTYARIDNSPGQKAFKDGILNQFKEVYGTRFNTKDTSPAAGMIATYGSRPVANPTMPIAPIAPEDPAATSSAPTTTAPTTVAKPTGPTTKPVAPMAKPVTGPTTKPAGTTGTKPGVAKVKKAGSR
ncbi:MAG: hypothetical protein JNL64_09680 [Blastocatellia bacterium]|nr:hypothetical protein [Blastocatellia bacterium]